MSTKLHYILLEKSYFQKPKIKALRRRWGAVGIVIHQAVQCDMGTAQDAEIDEDCFFVICNDFGLDDDRAREFLSYCLERELFYKGSKSFLIYCSRIREDQISLEKKQDNWRTSKRGARDKLRTNEGQIEDKSRTNEGQMKDKLRTSVGRVRNELLNTEDLNIEDLNIEDLNTEDLKASKAHGFRVGCERYGSDSHVYLKTDEYTALSSQFTFAVVDKKIISLDSNIENKIKKYTQLKNHASAIRNWCSSDSPTSVNYSRESNFSKNIRILKQVNEEARGDD